MKNLILILPCLFLLISCQKEEKRPKNIILVVGDGMGPQQIGLLLSYAKQAPGSVLKSRQTAFDRMTQTGAQVGISMTHPHGALVVDSAASANHMAGGVYSGSEMIGSNYQGNKITSNLVMAKKLGKSVGLVSDTRITHATPAAFAAHAPHRGHENHIAVDMLNYGVDVLFSGGIRHWIPSSANDKNSDERKWLETVTEGSVRLKSKRKDEVNLIRKAKEQGYSLAFNRNQLNSAKGKTLGLFAYSNTLDGIQETRFKNDPKRKIPTLNEMTLKALELLGENEKGFFLMVEAGQIDWTAHYNDTGGMLHEMLKLNETLNTILDWASERDDTLIVVTADHETGGFGFSYSSNDLPEAEELPGELFKNFPYKPNFNFGKPQVLDKIYEQKMTYMELFFDHFDALPQEQRNAQGLQKLVNSNTRFPITLEQAKRILEKQDNPYYVEGHKYLGSKVVPKIDTNHAFFSYQTDDNRLNLLGFAVSEQQQTVWATGTHTSTPVLVFSHGPSSATKLFKGIYHHVDIGNKIKELIK